MPERLKNSETNSDKGWSDFVSKNPDLNVGELQEKDPESVEIVKE